jgi:hypothetical protein
LQVSGVSHIMLTENGVSLPRSRDGQENQE